MNQIPTVVRLITRLNIGGPARQALLLTRELDDSFRTILGAGVPGPAEGSLGDATVKVRQLRLVREVSPLDDTIASLQIRRILRDQRPAIVHTHMAKAGALGRAAALTTRRRPKLVHTFHGHVFEGYFGSAAEKAFLRVERALAKRTDVLIAISPEIKESLLELGVGREEQYRTIPLGFDLSQHLEVDGPRGWLRRDLGVSDGTPLIGSVGRLVPIKDLTTLLEAMVELPEAHLAVVGDGELRRDLERLADRLGLMERVHFTGWITDIAGAMSDMDVIALSSLNEGTPVSLIEAAACAKPVVATDIGGVRYVVEHEKTGFVCPPKQPGALAGHIRTLLGDPEQRDRMGENARESVRIRFHKDRLLSEIRQLYTDLLP